MNWRRPGGYSPPCSTKLKRRNLNQFSTSTAREDQRRRTRWQRSPTLPTLDDTSGMVPTNSSQPTGHPIKIKLNRICNNQYIHSIFNDSKIQMHKIVSF